jgi:hypothetical protein
LLELLIGLLIMAVAATGFVGMLLVQFRAGNFTQKTDESATLMQSTIETFAGVCWDFLGSDVTGPSTEGLLNGDILTDGLLNRNGEESGIGVGPYVYYRHIVVCTIAEAGLVKDDPFEYCGSNLTGLRPPELACDVTPALTSREKLVQVLITWYDQNGECHWRHNSSLAFDWDGPTNVCVP